MSGNIQPQLDLKEHNALAVAKRVVGVSLDPSGQFSSRNTPDFASVAQTYTLVSITSSATQILPANTNRKAVIFQRASPATGTMRVGPSSAVTTTMGILMTAGSMFSDAGDGLYTGAWHGIIASGTEGLTVIEFE